MRDYVTTRTNKTSQIRLYTNVPRKKAAPSCNSVLVTQRMLRRAGLRVVIHPHKKSFLCSSARRHVVLGSVRGTHHLNTSKIIFNYLATRKSMSVPLVRRLVGTSRKVSIAFRHTFSMYEGLQGTVRSVVRLKYGHVLASKRRPATRQNVPLLGRLRRRTSSQVVLLTNYKIGRTGVTRVTQRANVHRFRFSTERGVRDSVLCRGSTISVKKAMRVSRCARAIAATRQMGHAVKTLLGTSPLTPPP